MKRILIAIALIVTMSCSETVDTKAAQFLKELKVAYKRAVDTNKTAVTLRGKTIPTSAASLMIMMGDSNLIEMKGK